MCSALCFVDTLFSPLGFEFAFATKPDDTKQAISVLCGRGFSHCQVGCSPCDVPKILVVIAG